MSKIYSGFIDPTGNKMTIQNLYAFCKKNNLSQSAMWGVASGKHKQHKGWTFLKNSIG